MSTTTYINRFLEPVVDAFTPEVARSLANLKADPELQARVDELADKANKGTLSPDEDAEYKSIVQAADIVSVIPSKARRYLTQHPG